MPGAIPQRKSELADVPGFDAAANISGDDATLAVQQQLNALNEAEQAQHDRTLAFQQQMVALHPEQYRESVAAPPPVAPRQQPRDFFQPPVTRSERSAANFVSAPVSRQIPDGSFERRAGRITLSPAQREAAKIAGVSETTYAAHVGELAKRKAQGFYEN